ncbi:unnamed protein product [Musa hybrid cultivar]
MPSSFSCTSLPFLSHLPLELMASLLTVVVVTLLCVGSGGGGAIAQAVQHHVVGDDLGWDLSSNLAAWSKDRIFRVGDEIWFAYAAAEERILELRSSDKLEECDLDDPIGMYTSGVDKVRLDGEGARYFASSTPENCKNGLKLRVRVVPRATNDEHTRFAAVSAEAAAGPVPSASARLKAPQLLWIAFVIAVAMWF